MKALLPPFLLLSLVSLIPTCACANFHTTLVPYGAIAPNIIFEAGTNGTAYVIAINKTWAEVNVTGTLETTHYEYVLNITNLSSNINYQVNLENASIYGISRLTNFTAYFHDGTTSKQVQISNGVVTQSVGSWYSIIASATIYLSLAIQVSTSGSSTVDLRLHIVKSDTTSPEIIQTVRINVN